MSWMIVEHINAGGNVCMMMSQKYYEIDKKLSIYQD
jgi:hypothetical protein